MTTETDYRRRIYELLNIPHFGEEYFRITITPEKTVFFDLQGETTLPPLVLNTGHLQFSHMGPDRLLPEGSFQIHWRNGEYNIYQWVSHPNCTEKGASEFPCAYVTDFSPPDSLYELLKTAHNQSTVA